MHAVLTRSPHCRPCPSFWAALQMFWFACERWDGLRLQTPRAGWASAPAATAAALLLLLPLLLSHSLLLRPWPPRRHHRWCHSADRQGRRAGRPVPRADAAPAGLCRSTHAAAGMAGQLVPWCKWHGARALHGHALLHGCAHRRISDLICCLHACAAGAEG